MSLEVILNKQQTTNKEKNKVKRSIVSLLLHDDAAELLQMTLKPKFEIIGGISALGVDTSI